MAKAIYLTDEEVEFLYMLCDQWLEDCPQALEDTIVDPCIESAEQLLDLVEGMERQVAVLKNIQAKLQREVKNDAA